ncbi:MAG: ABC transporter permease [Aeriscardovia sp.]|nr:ABC transporter permease [Aeriscardovia sp.]MBQ5504700.1 ABC transporter permease [Aeriscardovia sp.]MBQ5548491.1 ABC transporter permease [Prevotella sp.]MBR6434431.1 ABC transporter permease [Aeriscardovia sp.]
MKQYFQFSLKSVFRVPVSVFFTLVFPVMMMFVMMETTAEGGVSGGWPTISRCFPVVLAYGLLPLSLVTFPMAIGAGLDEGTMRRMEYFHVGFPVILASEILANVCLGMISIVVDVVCASLFYSLKAPAVYPGIVFFIQYIFAWVAFMFAGAFIGVVLKSSKAITAVGMVVMFAALFLCGAFVPFSRLPSALQVVGRFFPAKWMIVDSFQSWSGVVGFDWYCLALSGVWIVVFAALTVLVYRKAHQRLRCAVRGIQ